MTTLFSPLNPPVLGAFGSGTDFFCDYYAIIAIETAYIFGKLGTRE
jgi:hypothetical protein